MILKILPVITRMVPRFVFQVRFRRTEPMSVHIQTSSAYLFPLTLFLKKSSLLKVTQLVEVIAVDRVQPNKRFLLYYVFMSTSLNHKICVSFDISENESIPSITPIFPGALWLEREVWDLFGVFFYGHPDLRRILTDYGFEGFPLRKDFPLSGYIELRYDDERMHIVYEPVELAQNYRYFNSLSPWESVTV